MACDRVLPTCFGVPTPPIAELRQRVPNSLLLPTGVRYTLTDDDKTLAADAADFMAAYVAEALPAQVVNTDLRSGLPSAASRLAVRSRPGGDKDYIGSFDVILRLRASRQGTWRCYDGEEMALDCKLTGVSTTLGLNGATIRTYLQHAREVMQAARSEGCTVGRCSLVAFLIRRPPGVTAEGRIHRGASAFLALRTDVLLNWRPDARQPPRHIVLHGNLIQAGSDFSPDPLALNASTPARAPQRDRWAELGQCTVRAGWVRVLDFVRVFHLAGRQSEKKATEKVLKRMRANGNILDDDDSEAVGRPPKIARLRDLRQLHPDLQ